METHDWDCVYQYLRECAQQRRPSPTYREIAGHCLLSVGSIVRILDRLEIEGRIQREPGKARSIIIIDPSERH